MKSELLFALLSGRLVVFVVMAALMMFMFVSMSMSVAMSVTVTLLNPTSWKIRPVLHFEERRFSLHPGQIVS